MFLVDHRGVGEGDYGSIVTFQSHAQFQGVLVDILAPEGPLSHADRPLEAVLADLEGHVAHDLFQADHGIARKQGHVEGEVGVVGPRVETVGSVSLADIGETRGLKVNGLEGVPLGVPFHRRVETHQQGAFLVAASTVVSGNQACAGRLALELQDHGLALGFDGGKGGPGRGGGGRWRAAVIAGVEPDRVGCSVAPAVVIDKEQIRVPRQGQVAHGHAKGAKGPRGGEFGNDELAIPGVCQDGVIEPVAQDRIQVPVQVYVDHDHGVAVDLGFQDLSTVLEPALAIPDPHGAPRNASQGPVRKHSVQVSVPVQVAQGDPAGPFGGTARKGKRPERETAVPKAKIKVVGSRGAGYHDVQVPVAIDVGRGDPIGLTDRPVHKDLGHGLVGSHQEHRELLQTHGRQIGAAVFVEVSRDRTPHGRGWQGRRGRCVQKVGSEFPEPIGGGGSRGVAQEGDGRGAGQTGYCPGVGVQTACLIPSQLLTRREAAVAIVLPDHAGFSPVDHHGIHESIPVYVE